MIGQTRLTVNPVVAYAIDSTDRVVKGENRKVPSEAGLDEWNAACDAFEAMASADQRAWSDGDLATYPKIDEFAELDDYDRLN